MAKSKSNTQKINVKVLSSEDVYRTTKVPVVVAEKTYDVNVKYTLTYADMIRVISTIADGTAIVDDGEYMPEMYYSFMDCYILIAYTDIQLSGDIDENYAFAMQASDIIDAISPYVNASQVMDIKKAITDRIEFNKQLIIARRNNIDINDINKVLGELNVAADDVQFTENVEKAAVAN